MLRAHLETLGDRCHAGTHTRHTVHYHQTVATAPDHAVTAASIAKPGHCAEDSDSRRDDRGGQRLAAPSHDRLAVERKRLESYLWQRSQKRMLVDAFCAFVRVQPAPSTLVICQASRSGNAIMRCRHDAVNFKEYSSPLL
jgi:hypothetical protein